jgi:hypothetical protein
MQNAFRFYHWTNLLIHWAYLSDGDWQQQHRKRRCGYSILSLGTGTPHEDVFVIFSFWAIYFLLRDSIQTEMTETMYCLPFWIWKNQTRNFTKGFWRWFVFRITEFMHFFHRLIKTKSKRLKLLRFEIWFWFRPQVKNMAEGVEG